MVMAPPIFRQQLNFNVMLSYVELVTVCASALTQYFIWRMPPYLLVGDGIGGLAMFLSWIRVASLEHELLPLSKFTGIL